MSKKLHSPISHSRMNSPEGFTLLEIMIAVTIVSIAGIMLLRTMGNSVQLQAESEFILDAILLAQEVMTETESASVFIPALEEREFEKPYQRFRYQKLIENAGFPNVYHIALTIYHDDDQLFTIHEYVSTQTFTE